MIDFMSLSRDFIDKRKNVLESNDQMNNCLRCDPDNMKIAQNSLFYVPVSTYVGAWMFLLTK